MLGEIHPKSFKQDSLFALTQDLPDHTETLMSLLDQINQRYGRHKVYIEATGAKKHTWQMQHGLKSPDYTTCWRSLVQFYLR